MRCLPKLSVVATTAATKIRMSHIFSLTTRLLFFFYDQKKSLHPLPAESHAAARSMKLLAKIPKDAEATVVLVGKSVNALPFHLVCLQDRWFRLSSKVVYGAPVCPTYSAFGHERIVAGTICNTESHSGFEVNFGKRA